MIAYYEPEIITAFDYYPFGMMSRMWYDSDYPNYRFGFNGKEMDHEAKGNFAQLDYGFRIYDPRAGRFLSVDPLAKSYPELTLYQFASNSPIANIDLDGGESKYFNVENIEIYNGEGKLILEDIRHTEDKSKEAGFFVKGALYRSSGKLGDGFLFKYYNITVRPTKDGREETLIEDGGALYIRGKGRGGLYFVSSTGGYSHSSGSLDEGDGIPINLDLLVAAVGGFPKGNLDTEMSPFAYSGDEVNKLAELTEILKSDKKFLAKVEKVLSGFKALLNAEKSGEKVGKSLDEYLSGHIFEERDKLKSEGAKFFQCEACNAYRKVGEKNYFIARDTANKGITPTNTKKIKLEDFHSN